jgi:hypothetical protein
MQTKKAVMCGVTAYSSEVAAAAPTREHKSDTLTPTAAVMSGTAS